MTALIQSRIFHPFMLVIATTLVVMMTSPVDSSEVRIKDITTFQNSSQRDLIGYGLVVGLDGTGDGKGTQFTIQSLTNMMERLGLTVDASKVKVKNVAAVLVTSSITSDYAPGAAFDVSVSSIGDASSLQGGTLLMTPLADAEGNVWAMAQGPVSIGGFNVQVDQGNKIVNNYTLVGRVPNGGKITNELPAPLGSEKEFFISITNPDVTTAHRIAERINIRYGLTAYAVDAGSVRVIIPDSLNYPSTRMKFISDIGHLTVVPDNNARVVINERTGTIVAGQHVTIEPVAVAHGTITVNIQSSPVISQPAPFSQGNTVVTQEPQISINDENAHVVHLKGTVYLSDVAEALNKIGATPRDIIAIFQAMKQAGALRSELVIL